MRAAAPAVIPRDRLSAFIRDVFWTYNDVLVHHRKLLNRLHEIQREEHPHIRSITAPIYDAALNWQDAYMEYVPHYPISAFRIQEELGNNPAFKAFHDVSNQVLTAHVNDTLTIPCRHVYETPILGSWT